MDQDGKINSFQINMDLMNKIEKDLKDKVNELEEAKIKNSVEDMKALLERFVEHLGWNFEYNITFKDWDRVYHKWCYEDADEEDIRVLINSFVEKEND